MSEPSGVETTTIVVKDRRAGSGAGIAAIVFGILGIFFIGILFVPLSLIFSIIALFKRQIGLGILGLICCIVAALSSPSLWAIFGLAALWSIVS